MSRSPVIHPLIVALALSATCGCGADEPVETIHHASPADGPGATGAVLLLMGGLTALAMWAAAQATRSQRTTRVGDRGRDAHPASRSIATSPEQVARVLEQCRLESGEATPVREVVLVVREVLVKPAIPRVICEYCRTIRSVDVDHCPSCGAVAKG